MKPLSSNDAYRSATRRPPLDLIGTSPGLTKAVQMAKQVAPTELPVLVVGETGTGKELLTRQIHRLSGRRGALVPVDCGALPEQLVESLLFGHRKGAFTSAVDHSPGLIAAADNGTLFLDELGSLPHQSQAKLLRVLETGVVQRVGGLRGRTIGFRLVATALPDVADMVSNGHFRYDLLQRVAGVVIRLPPLRERASDVRLLARSFARYHGLELDDRATDLLARREWPGNVRELKWMLARSALFATGDVIDQEAVQLALEIGPMQLVDASDRTAAPTDGLVALRALCVEHRGDAATIADAMGIGLSTLYRRLRSAGIRLEPFRSTASGDA